jgi:hypothetical protein
MAKGAMARVRGEIFWLAEPGISTQAKACGYQKLILARYQANNGAALLKDIHRT